MKSLFFKYTDIIENKNLSYFTDTKDLELVYRDLDKMNSAILDSFKTEKDNIATKVERREYVKAKLLDVDYLTKRTHRAPLEIQKSLSKSLIALHLTISLHV